MAVNDSGGSLHQAMREGALNGAFKSENPNRGGKVEPTTSEALRNLDSLWSWGQLKDKAEAILKGVIR